MSSPLYPIAMAMIQNSLSQSHESDHVTDFCRAPQRLPKLSGHSSDPLAEHRAERLALCPQALSTLAMQSCAWNIFALLCLLHTFFGIIPYL